MKVSIRVTVDIDVDAWALEYGVAKGDVREDVRAWATNGIVAGLDDAGMLAHHRFKMHHAETPGEAGITSLHHKV